MTEMIARDLEDMHKHPVRTAAAVIVTALLLLSPCLLVAWLVIK